SMFESGAILLYLAEKTGRYLPADLRGRAEVLQWLFWQMGGLGPMAGQNGHFNIYGPQNVHYPFVPSVRATARLYGVLDRSVADRDYVAGDYSIADMACHPRIRPYESHGQDLAAFPSLHRWFDAINERPAAQRS